MSAVVLARELNPAHESDHATPAADAPSTRDKALRLRPHSPPAQRLRLNLQAQYEPCLAEKKAGKAIKVLPTPQALQARRLPDGGIHLGGDDGLDRRQEGVPSAATARSRAERRLTGAAISKGTWSLLLLSGWRSFGTRGSCSQRSGRKVNSILIRDKKE